jgi:hypothetical protein
LAKDEIDDRIAAVEAVEFLKDVLAKHAQTIAMILAEIEKLRARMATVEAGGRGK